MVFIIDSYFDDKNRCSGKLHVRKLQRFSPVVDKLSDVVVDVVVGSGAVIVVVVVVVDVIVVVVVVGVAFYVFILRYLTFIKHILPA